MANKKDNYQFLLIGGALLLAVVYFAPGLIPTQPAVVVPGTSPGTVTVGDGITISNPVTFTETTNAYNKDLPGTVVGSPSITQWVDGIKQASQDTTPPVGSTEVLLVDKASWYGTTIDTNGISQFIVPNETQGIRSFNLAGEDTAVDLVVINSDGLTANASSSAEEAIGTGGAKTVTVRVQGGTPRTYFGNPFLASVQANILCADANATDFKMSDFTVQQVGGSVLNVVSAPAQLTIGSTANQSRCWELPGTSGTDKFDLAFTIVAQTSVDPTANINLNMYDADYYTDVYGSLQYGVESDVSADIGATNETETIYVS